MKILIGIYMLLCFVLIFYTESSFGQASTLKFFFIKLSV